MSLCYTDLTLLSVGSVRNRSRFRNKSYKLIPKERLNNCHAHLSFVCLCTVSCYFADRNYFFSGLTGNSILCENFLLTPLL